MGFREMAVVVAATPRDLTGTLYFLLVMMANKTTADGYVFASIDELAADLHVSSRTVQRTIQDLVALGHLEECAWDDLPEHLPKPRADRRPRLYRIAVVHAAAPRGDNLTPRNGARGVNGSPRGDISASRGDTAMSPDRESDRESERDSDARTREEPDPKVLADADAALAAAEGDLSTAINAINREIISAQARSEPHQGRITWLRAVRADLVRREAEAKVSAGGQPQGR